MIHFLSNAVLLRALISTLMLLAATNALAERYSFIYTYTGEVNNQPLSDGSILTGEIEGHLDLASQNAAVT